MRFFNRNEYEKLNYHTFNLFCVREHRI